MQSLDVISLNIWNILISLANLAIMYFILRKFLYAPVRKVLAARQGAVDEKYAAAEKAKSEALSDKEQWEAKLAGARDEADAIITKAGERAERRGEQLIADAREKADGIVRAAKSEAESERKRAEDQMREEIADVSTLLAEKLIGKKLTDDDHKILIDSFLDGIGEDDDADK